ncbi:nicotinate (nicotinamide) nucleotide adenylyltransferase [Pseudodesulfovibrio tunisiensis]|uniref:nicotinate (nicotinamide) nucleotide adenylyltransferase n=1 Tax=Pseudodesulfovibrio tunisiensis TaxID=463192 RepID=UPI001FB32A50|nr:nicotinate (nicotinamide) nucleotide adenylyltransferase [Pseudodesulfovibrio tunisiensis]
MNIGILGGSFNPVHTGHVRMGIEVLESLRLDRVDLMPANVPPHKGFEGMLPFSLRLELVRRAVEDIPGLGVTAIEGERPGPSYTYDTMRQLTADHPQDHFHFLLGASTFLELCKWNQGLEIVHFVSLTVVNRWEAAGEVAGFVHDHWPEAERCDKGVWTFDAGTEIRVVDIPRLDIKGGHIRDRWRAGRSLRLLVPDGVKRTLDRESEIVAAHWGERESR